jgi:hypothetical protein
MAKLLGKVHWDPEKKKVVTTYQVLQTDPNDKIQFFTKDSQPFVVQTTDMQLVERFGLQKVKNADDLYQVEKGPPPEPLGEPNLLPTGTGEKGQLKCGTLDEHGHFKPWPSGWGSPD